MFKLERAGYGWVQFDEINNRDRLIDKSLGRLQHGYSVILANMCDYGYDYYFVTFINYKFSIDINKSLNRLDMSDYGKLDKTMLNYLIISLSNLKRKKKKTQSSVLSECLGKIKHFIFCAKLIIFRRTGQQTNFARVGHEQCDFN